MGNEQENKKTTTQEAPKPQEAPKEKPLRAGVDWIESDEALVQKIRTVKKVSGIPAGEFNKKCFLLGMDLYMKSEEFKKAVAMLKGLM